jgi:hypothetical protein
MCKQFSRKFKRNQKKELQREVRFQTIWDSSDNKLKNSSKTVIRMRKKRFGNACSAIKSLKLASFYLNT